MNACDAARGTQPGAGASAASGPRARRWPTTAGLVLALCASLPAAFGQAQPADAGERRGQYLLDPDGSSMTFEVDAFASSRIRMRFRRMHAQLEGTEAGLDAGRVMVAIDTASFDASPSFLSPIIKGGGMLDVARYPEIRFVSTRFVQTGEGGGLLVGNLTIRGITHQVTLLVTPSRAAEHPKHAGSLAFSAAGDISRRAFGLSAWSPIVGDAVHMSIQVEFVHTP